ELPPDELPVVTGRWLGECKQIIESSSGRVNQFMGDGFFACWHDRERIELNIHKALQALGRMQEQALPLFRFVAHLGKVAGCDGSRGLQPTDRRFAHRRASRSDA